jgi:uncharacterized protein (TIGR02452 family)
MGRFAWVAQENERLFEEGRYLSPGRMRVDLFGPLQKALNNTKLYRPDELTGLLKRSAAPEGEPPKIEVVEGKTAETAKRLTRNGKTALLNFASARNPGGGYKRGAQAQEEDLCRCSALYPTLLKQPDYYSANRSQGSLLYTDHIIYSDAVPFFREDNKYEYLESVVPLSVITAPAPNAGEHLRRDPTDGATVKATLVRRAGFILAVAEDQGIRNLVLGAWGCGVFRNDPEVVADAFGQWLEGPRFRGTFDRVVFGIYAAGLDGKVNLEAFRLRFSS